ncbi:MAG: tetratricopeptide repeat protein, partial [Planctomycetota bacterium]
ARRASMGYQLRKCAIRHKMFCAFFAGLLGILIGAWFWVQRIDEEWRSATQRSANTTELRDATLALDAAKGYYAAKNYDKAVGYYRDALAGFERLGRFEARNTGEAKLGLGLALSEGPGATLGDLKEAEALVTEAAALFQKGGAEWQDPYQRAILLAERLRQQMASGVDGVRRDPATPDEQDGTNDSDKDERAEGAPVERKE